jgi:hypothetical protein
VPRVQSLMCLIKRRVHGTYCDFIRPCILDLCTSRRWLVRFTLRPLHSPQSKHQYPLAGRLGKNCSWSGQCMGQKYFLLLPGIESRLLGCPVHSLLNIHSGDPKFMQEWAGFVGAAQMCRHFACLQLLHLNFMPRCSYVNITDYTHQQMHFIISTRWCGNMLPHHRVDIMK